VPARPLPPTGQQTGIALGLESFATLANRQPIVTPRHYRKAQACLRRCQRRVAQRKQGSHRRRAAVALLAKAHQHSARQRREFQHQEARQLVQTYEVIYHEDLQVANMVQTHSLANSIADAGWSAFLTILAFTAAHAVKRVAAVNPAFTSQRCCGPGCGRSRRRACRCAGMPAHTVGPVCIGTTTLQRTENLPHLCGECQKEASCG